MHAGLLGFELSFSEIACQALRGGIRHLDLLRLLHVFFLEMRGTWASQQMLVDCIMVLRPQSQNR